MALQSSLIDDVSSQLQKADINENFYEKTRACTFIRYYKQLSAKLNPEHFAMLEDALTKGDDNSLRHVYDMGLLDLLYDTNKSITQSLRSQAGRSLEHLIENKLTAMNISFAKQVYIKDNKVCKKTPKDKGGHILDFVVPRPDVGANIANFIHVSSKTTLRERVHQDQHIQCKKTLL